jgi:hypothetical protein
VQGRGNVIVDFTQRHWKTDDSQMESFKQCWKQQGNVARTDSKDV